MATRKPSSNVAAISKTMALLSTCGFVLLPIIVAYRFLSPGTSAWLMFEFTHLGAQLNESIPLGFRIAALGCAFAPTAFTMWALWSLRQLFLLYARGSIFSGDALRILNRVAIALFASVVVAFIAQAPISFLLSWPLGEGHRLVSLSFGSEDVTTLFISGVVLAIARVMAEGQRIADENAKFV